MIENDAITFIDDMYFKYFGSKNSNNTPYLDDVVTI
jgi:hypothetical protein